MKDLYNGLNMVALVEAADLVHADTKSKYIDLAGFEGCDIVVAVGALTGVDGSNYLTPVLYEADATPESASSYSAVAAAQILGGFTKIDSTSEDSVLQRAGYVGNCRYLYVDLDYTGTGISAGVVGVYAVLGHGRHQPSAALTPTTGAVS